MLCLTLLVETAMPCAAMITVFAELFGGDSSAAVKSILLSSLLSIITVPGLMLLSGFF
jgi:predicted permease